MLDQKVVANSDDRRLVDSCTTFVDLMIVSVVGRGAGRRLEVAKKGIG